MFNFFKRKQKTNEDAQIEALKKRLDFLQKEYPLFDLVKDRAEAYIKWGLSQEELYRQLLFDGFTEEETQYAVNILFKE